MRVCACVCVCFSVFIAVDFMSSCNILILLLNRVVRSGFYVSAECQFPSMLYIPKAGYFVFEYFGVLLQPHLYSSSQRKVEGR